MGAGAAASRHSARRPRLLLKGSLNAPLRPRAALVLLCEGVIRVCLVTLIFPVLIGDSVDEARLLGVARPASHARGGGEAVESTDPPLRFTHQQETPPATYRVWRRGGGSAPSAAGPGDDDRTYFGGGPISAIDGAR